MTNVQSSESFDLATARFNPNTVAIVTGSAEGIGKALAEALLQKDAKVIPTSLVDMY